MAPRIFPMVRGMVRFRPTQTACRKHPRRRHHRGPQVPKPHNSVVAPRGIGRISGALVWSWWQASGSWMGGENGCVLRVLVAWKFREKTRGNCIENGGGCNGFLRGKQRKVGAGRGGRGGPAEYPWLQEGRQSAGGVGRQGAGPLGFCWRKRAPVSRYHAWRRARRVAARWGSVAARSWCSPGSVARL